MDWLANYQDLLGSLLSGLFTLGAGAFVFVEGNRRLRAERARDHEALRARENIASGMVAGLESHLAHLRNKLEEFEELRQDFIDGFIQHPEIRMPTLPIEARSLALYLNQLSTFPSLHGVVFCLFDLIQQLERLDSRYEAFSRIYSRALMRTRGSGPSLFSDLPDMEQQERLEAEAKMENGYERAIDSLTQVGEAIKAWRALGRNNHGRQDG